MTRPWGLIQHVPHEGPGIIATEALARGIRLDVRRVYAGDAVHALREIEGLVVMGGPMGANDDERHPNLAAERDLLGGAVRAGYPVLGVCLGAQLLAAALGGRVHKGPAEENGFGEVTLTREGERDPVLGPAGPAIPVCHWHSDTFDLPPGAVHLATSGRYPNQAFRVGDRAYGFQFHVEVDEALYGEWVPFFPPGARFDKALRPAVERAGKGMVARFFDAFIGGAS